MSNIDNCLLIGNGLNRCLHSGISWSNLLKDIAAGLGTSYNPSITLPLEYERIANEALQNKPYGDESFHERVKEEIADKLKQAILPKDAVHRKLQNLPINTIMTTNYDVLLEYVFNDQYELGKGDLRFKYLFDSTAKISKKDFYHLHGIVTNPKTLCLGYEHYMGVVEHLRNRLTKIDKAKKEKVVQQILRGDYSTNGWPEKFFNSNIGIIGLGLTECELDLWWLLVYRASLYYTNLYQARKRMKNVIVFYDILDERKAADEKAEKERQTNIDNQLNRHCLLEKEHVVIRIYRLGKEYSSYIEAYNAIFDEISTRGIVTT